MAAAAKLIPAPSFAAAIANRPALVEPTIRRRLRQTGAGKAALGLPGVADESWRMTNLRSWADAPLQPAGGIADLAGAAEAVACPHDATRFVFVNGAFRSDLSAEVVDEADVYIAPMAIAARDRADLVETALGFISETENDAISALNAAFHQDGLFIWLAPNARPAKPIAIAHVTGSGVTAHPRHAIVLSANSELTLIESATGVGDAAYLSNSVLEAHVGDGAKLTRRVLQTEKDAAASLAQTWVRVSKDAVFDNFALQVGSALARDDIRVRLEGPGAHTALHGAFLGRDAQHFDTMSVISHDREQTTSEEMYRIILDDASVGVFQGRIEVAQDAQQIAGDQMSRGLLLSDRSRALFKPELEIFADDVKCSHGSTIGQLDENALFYLRARGVPEKRARRLLIEAFVAEGLDHLGDTAIRKWFDEAAFTWLDR